MRKKTVAVGLGLLCAAGLVWLWMLLLTERGQQRIQDALAGMGVLAPAAFVLLQTLQIVLAVIPGEPVELLSGTLFGTAGGSLLCLSGAFLGSVLVWALVQRFGTRWVSRLFPEYTPETLLSRFDKQRLTLFVFLLFFLPGTPKDLLTYLVPLTGLSECQFYLITVLARIPSVATSAYAGAKMGQGSPAVSLTVFAVTGLIAACGLWVWKRLMRE